MKKFLKATEFPLGVEMSDPNDINVFKIPDEIDPFDLVGDFDGAAISATDDLSTGTGGQKSIFDLESNRVRTSSSASSGASTATPTPRRHVQLADFLGESPTNWSAESEASPGNSIFGVQTPVSSSDSVTPRFSVGSSFFSNAGSSPKAPGLRPETEDAVAAALAKLNSGATMTYGTSI